MAQPAHVKLVEPPMNPRVLMVYDKFPPFNVSGTARAFHFARQLPLLGWDVTVLAKTPEPHEIADASPLAELPSQVSVLSTAPWLGPGKDRVAAWLNRQRNTRGVESSQRAAGAAAPERSNPRRVFRRDSWAWRATGLPMWLVEWHLDWAPRAISCALSDARARSADERRTRSCTTSSSPSRRAWIRVYPWRASSPLTSSSEKFFGTATGKVMTHFLSSWIGGAGLSTGSSFNFRSFRGRHRA